MLRRLWDVADETRAQMDKLTEEGEKLQPVSVHTHGSLPPPCWWLTDTDIDHLSFEFPGVAAGGAVQNLLRVSLFALRRSSSCEEQHSGSTSVSRFSTRGSTSLSLWL